MEGNASNSNQGLVFFRSQPVKMRSCPRNFTTDASEIRHSSSKKGRQLGRTPMKDFLATSREPLENEVEIISRPNTLHIVEVFRIACAHAGRRNTPIPR